MSALRLGPVTMASELGRSSPTTANSSSSPARMTSSGDERDVNVRQQRRGSRFLRRGREHDAAGVGQGVGGPRNARAGDLGRVPAMDDEAGDLRVRRELVDKAHRRSL